MEGEDRCDCRIHAGREEERLADINKSLLRCWNCFTARVAV
jgi:hypothetical protein